ncbi:hypothetical protein AAG906_016858 [Vitis piasezkii]
MVPCVCMPMCYHPYVTIDIIGIPTCHLILNMACQPHVIGLVLKVESTTDKTEWLNKLRNVIHLQSTQLVALELTYIWSSIQWRKTCRFVRRARWMSQEVRGYVEVALPMSQKSVLNPL